MTAITIASYFSFTPLRRLFSHASWLPIAFRHFFLFSDISIIYFLSLIY